MQRPLAAAIVSLCPPARGGACAADGFFSLEALGAARPVMTLVGEPNIVPEA